jgi:transcriptional regulator with XRE-family HTH domain
LTFTSGSFLIWHKIPNWDSNDVGNNGRVSQTRLGYISNMGFREQVDSYFGERVRKERDRLGWSQEELARRMTDRGIPAYASTIAKIESGRKPRPARLGEAIVIADLFEAPVSALLGRPPDETTLTFAMVTLMGYMQEAEQRILEAKQAMADIGDQLDDAEDRFDSPHLKVLQRTAHDMAEHLDAAQALAGRLTATATLAIADVDRGTEK